MKTIALRFADNYAPAEGTIKLHEDVIKEYGCDSLRYFLSTSSALGQDLRYDTEKIKSSWNFINKLWNASRFVLMNIEDLTDNNINKEELTLSDKWILTKKNLIIKSVEEALIVVPQSLQDASLSLGATKAQTILKVVLPCCINGILTGVLLSIGRVIGESAALIYTMGTFISDNPTINGSATSLSLMIWSFMSSEQPNFELACAISIIILAIVLVLNIIVKIIGKKLDRSY